MSIHAKNCASNTEDIIQTLHSAIEISIPLFFNVLQFLKCSKMPFFGVFLGDFVELGLKVVRKMYSVRFGEEAPGA